MSGEAIRRPASAEGSFISNASWKPERSKDARNCTPTWTTAFFTRSGPDVTISPIETCIKNPKHNYEEHCYQSYSPTQVWMKKVLRDKQQGSVNGVCGAIDVVSGFRRR